MVRYDMPLEFTDAIFGTEKEFEAAHLEACAACTGTGARAGTSRKNCPTCGGMGQVMRTQDTPFGTFSQVLYDLKISHRCTSALTWFCALGHPAVGSIFYL